MIIFYAKGSKGGCYTLDRLEDGVARKRLCDFYLALQKTGKPPEELDGLTLVGEGITDEDQPYAEYK